ncbi:MAG: hypothetical protein K2N70_06085, partial [Helicobacter sp.]|nr:hypothetical protein [Helicobacter sp.]
KCLAFATRLSLCAKRCLTIPQTPSTLFKCALHLHMSIIHSASSMLCLWLEHRRCALWLGVWNQ